MRAHLLFFLSLCSLAPLMAQEQIIPKPVSIERGAGAPIELQAQSRILLDRSNTELVKAARLMQQSLHQATGYACQLGDDVQSAQNHDIIIKQDASLREKSPEAYRIRATNSGIRIDVASHRGLLNALASIMQMLPADGAQLSASPFIIEDYPRFAWRGFLLDEARYFFGVDAVKQLLDQMHLLKMNVLHWHLTDDAGWRIEIKRYPRLTEIGAHRSDTEIETWGSGKYSGQAVSGYYTQAQIRDIVAYAAARNIMIVPEVDIPAHSSAAAVSYPELSLKTPSAVPTSFTINTAIDPTKEFSYTFYQHVFEELAELFPCPYLHMGGDEVRFDEQWEGEPAISAFMSQHKMRHFEELQRYFTIKMNHIIKNIGRRSIAWNEILHRGASSSPDWDTGIIIHHWVGGDKALREAIAAGHEVINASSNHTYLARSYENIPLEKAYAFDPLIEGLSPEQEQQILGLSCQMWTEWTPTLARMHEQAFPRAIAYAETGWSPKEAKCYKDFTQRLKHYLKRLEAMGISYKRT
ncbi:MAG: beta-N-acetylhexosaminidase [Akkermansia sp.]